MHDGQGRRLPPAPSESPINILIVDDEPKNLTVLEAVLDDPGYRLVRAESAQEALLALVGEDFALLILDIRMPGMTGFELAGMVKERKKTAQVPIIFLTAFYNEDQHVLAGYGTGAVDYLHKPVNPTILRSKVAVFAELYRRQREIEKANRALLAESTERLAVVEQLRELNENLELRVSERTEALADLDRRKDEFLAMMSHELRSPLAPIAAALHLLAGQRESETPVQQQALGIIERQMSHLQHLVADLLEVSRITTGRIQLRRKPVVIGDVVKSAVETVRPLFESRIEFTLSLPAEPIVLQADEARLEQVLVNLLGNAAKYTDNGGRIWLTAEQQRDNVIIRVKDTGVGISPALLPRIFDLFIQAEQTLDRSQGGLGIGLALVKRFTELHGGRVEAFSTMGQGSEFVVRLPVTSTDLLEADSPAAETPEPAKSSLRVLVVDDNMDTVLMTSVLLRDWGHDVRTAPDGESAVLQALEYQPNVILMDIGLPGLDGYGVARRLRLEPALQNVVLIALTGYGRESDRQAAADAGFNHHMVKPADFEKLEQILSSVTPGPAR